MILELDIGNSRGKWRVVREGGDAGPVRTSPLPHLARAPELPAAVARMRMGAVADPEGVRRLCEALEHRYGVPVEQACSGVRCQGVTNGYCEPGRLGVDRWLAIVAAYAEQRCPLLVVDAGSALTLDLVEGSGQHLGGYILPGHRLQAQSLAAGTGRVQVALDGGPETLEPGRSTLDAVAGGVALALSGAVQSAWRRARSRWPGCQLVVTGGDAPLLRALLDVEPECCHWRPHLVLDGLRHVLP